MSEIKTYRIRGRYRRTGKYYLVYKDIRALKLEDALEKFFSEVGRHGIKRHEIEILKIEEIDPADIRNIKLRKLVIAESPALFIEE